MAGHSFVVGHFYLPRFFFICLSSSNLNIVAQVGGLTIKTLPVASGSQCSNVQTLCSRPPPALKIGDQLEHLWIEYTCNLQENFAPAISLVPPFLAVDLKHLLFLFKCLKEVHTFFLRRLRRRQVARSKSEAKFLTIGLKSHAHNQKVWNISFFLNWMQGDVSISRSLTFHHFLLLLRRQNKQNVH